MLSRQAGLPRKVKGCMLGFDALLNPLRVKGAYGRGGKERRTNSENDSDDPDGDGAIPLGPLDPSSRWRSRFAGKSMAATSVHKFAQSITCHAWSPDLSMIAFCPNNSEVHIYKLSEDKWEKVHVLQKHDQIISGIDWSYRSNKIVTVSHDRNSYVWNQETTGWVPTLVILRLNRAALCVQWSPKENKFAVGSGAKTVCICYYEQENNWWVSKLIRKRHDSSVTSIAWHPNNILLATTSTDGKCRVFSTFIKGVDAKDSAMGNSAGTKFGEQIVQLDLCFCWAFGVRWSPSGNTLAYVGHNSMIYFVDEVGPSAAAQSVAIRDLPLRDVGIISF
ncbi:protein 2 3 complex subunit [Datura stramonium]|uniref:Arp2/3 complex 41 kDa subunit n=1 Tax=Datura stramonium TaxID=4076 RepID=A0ABS8SZ96_DATST|nr:protein 2 3 complex subunit [Datura stramonium]